MTEKLKECFASAKKAEEKGKKHKGLLISKQDIDLAKIYITKAKRTLELCATLMRDGFDYKLPEEWFYALYYCALAILSKFGIETRNQRCTAAFLHYVKDKGLIKYDSDLIERITVHVEKGEESDVDKRENARYGPALKIKEIEKQYDKMMDVCRRAISQCEEMIHSEKELKIPKELLE